MTDVVTPPQTSQWDCRWPDPVALKVANDRLLASLSPDDPSLNRTLGVTVRMEPPDHPNDPVSALLVSPWAVERVFWHHGQPGSPPPIIHVAELELDAHGRVAAGQGVILETQERTVPVVIGWEPETGHHFVHTLLHRVHDFDTVDAAINEALGVHPLAPTHRSLSGHMQKKISRRGLFGLSSLFKNRTDD
ncbi:MAG: hypothetical protein HQL75_09790 [Magnetococcales bacterium]|nr:hypothetical protein [Magnetococcales bacterium]